MSTQRNIEIFDNVFSHSFRSKLYKDILDSDYNIGWEDTRVIQHRDKVFMYSHWDLAKCIKSGFLSNIENKELNEKIAERMPRRCVVNCGTLSDVYIPHSHAHTDVLLYYANLEWKPEWNGETSFYSDDLQQIIFTNVSTLRGHVSRGTL